MGHDRGRERRTASGASILVQGDVVTKVHRAGTDVALLQRRLDAVAGAPFVQPLGPVRTQNVDGVPYAVTRWPRVRTADPDDPPWAAAGALLAELHRCGVPPGLPGPTWPERVVRARARTDVPLLQSLGDELAAAASQRLSCAALIHGDWHLGQLGQLDGRWLLLDPDDLAVGDPAWDLARPAGFWAAGLLDDAAWHAFTAAHGLEPDPWPRLDLPARCAVYVATVRAVTHRQATADALLRSCARMARWRA